MSHPIQIGTSGWSYGDWAGPFYPAGTKKGEYLERYAQSFDLVEVDSTYYACPSVRTAAGWAERTPDQFRFALKVPSTITHENVLCDCEREVDQFLSAIEPLRPKILCLLLQFGYFNRTAFASGGAFFERLRAFLELCKPGLERGTPIRVAVEIRNKNWLGAPYFALLREFGAPAVLVEHAWLPPIEKLIEQYDVVTGPFSYARLIGDRDGIEKITNTWEKTVVDRTADLQRVAGALRRIAEKVPVVTFVNNHYAGHGPATCRAMRKCLDE